MAVAPQTYIINDDGTLWLWDSATQASTNLGTFHLEGSDTVLRFLDVAVAPDGQVYVVGGSQIFRLDLETHLATALFNTFKVISALEIDPQGRFILGYDSRDFIEVFDPETFAVLQHFRTDPKAGSLFGGPTSAGDLVLVGNTLYFAAKHALGTSHPDEIILYDRTTGAIIDRWENPLAADTQGLTHDGESLIGFVGHVAYRITASGYTPLQDFGAGWDVNGASGTVSLQRTAGADFLQGTALDNLIAALGGDDTIVALQGNDTVQGGGGHDLIYGGDGADLLTGGTGLDTLRGGAGADSLYGGEDNDLFVGGYGADRCFGGSGADRIYGNAGADSLNGGAGRDRLTGGSGPDTFVFTSAAEAGDTITDFSNRPGNDDRIQIRAAGFGAEIPTGVLAADQFLIRADTQAQDSNDHVIYNTSNHTLWFDANGSAAGGLTLLARLEHAPVLTAADFLIT